MTNAVGPTAVATPTSLGVLSRNKLSVPEVRRVSVDEKPVALPKLYGAPAYARPRAAVLPSERPFDPDHLPLQVYQTDEELRFAAHLPARVYASSVAQGDLREPTDGGSSDGLRPRQFSLRAIAGRLLGDN